VGGLKKRGPRHKRRKDNPTFKKPDVKLPTVEELDEDREFDEFKRMMEGAPSYRRHHGAMRQVKHD
jgi:hypothetical protein